MQMKMFWGSVESYQDLEDNVSKFLLSDKVGEVYFIKQSFYNQNSICIIIFFDAYCPGN